MTTTHSSAVEAAVLGDSMPEINFNNYNVDDVHRLQQWAFEAATCLQELSSQQEVAAPVLDVPTGLIACLRGGRQCDEDGFEIIMSRQACCEAADILESISAARVPVASPAEPEGDVQLRACDQTTGREYFIKNGPRAAMQAEAYAMNEKGRYYFVIPPLPATPPVGAGGAGVMDAQPDSFHSDSGECDRVQGPGPTDAERTLRRLLCLIYSRGHAYTDDGELSDSRQHPSIDFLRDAPADIEAKMTQRNADTLIAPAQAVLLEHSGCGSNTQVDSLTVRLNPGDKVVLLKGRMTQEFDRADAAILASKGGDQGEGVMDAQPDSFHSDSGECGRVQRVELSGDELALFQQTLEDFADCGETETDYEVLVNWAQRGLLECINFQPTAAAHRMLSSITSTDQKGNAA